MRERNQIKRLLEAFTNRVYLVKQYENKKNDMMKDEDRFASILDNPPSRDERSVFDNLRSDSYCPQVRPPDDLMFDLIKWKNEYLNR